MSIALARHAARRRPPRALDGCRDRASAAPSAPSCASTSAPRPPARAPTAPWIWVATAADRSAARGRRGARRCVRRRRRSTTTLAARRSRAGSPSCASSVEPGPPPVGFVARSTAAARACSPISIAPRTRRWPCCSPARPAPARTSPRATSTRAPGRNGELVPINCAAIPNELIEGELFGYVRGAFSGAVADYDGLLRGRGRRHRVPRRGRRHAEDAADQAAARARGPRRRRGSARTRGARSTSASSPRPTATSASSCAAASSAPTSTSASRSSGSSCRRCASAPTTSPSSRAHLDRALLSRGAGARRTASTRVDRVGARRARALSVARQRPRAAQRRCSRRWSTSAPATSCCSPICPSTSCAARPTRRPAPVAARARSIATRSRACIDDGTMNLRALRDELERTALELALAARRRQPRRAPRACSARSAAARRAIPAAPCAR